MLIPCTFRCDEEVLSAEEIVKRYREEHGDADDEDEDDLELNGVYIFLHTGENSYRALFHISFHCSLTLILDEIDEELLLDENGEVVLDENGSPVFVNKSDAHIGVNVNNDSDDGDVVDDDDAIDNTSIKDGIGGHSNGEDLLESHSHVLKEGVLREEGS